MTTPQKAALATYARSLLACVLTAIITVAGNEPLYSLTQKQWLEISNAIYVSLLPVVLRYLNPKDAAYGLGSLKR